jgi:FAD/FMN-containing dehydrogenase/Fe-S oxidoreductase
VLGLLFKPSRFRASRGKEEGNLKVPGDLFRSLQNHIKGEVRFDDGARALYATDGSNYRQVPIGVVIPKSIEDVEETVRLCQEAGTPILSRGCGTSLAGQCCNEAVILDFSKYLHSILEIKHERKLARVQPGLVLDHLRKETEKQHLTFGPDPATHQWCTFGGMIGNNSCGVHSVMSGRTSDNIEEMEILTYRGDRFRVGKTSEAELEQIISSGGAKGEIYKKLRTFRDRYADEIRARFPKIPRRVSGYNLNELLPENGFHVARALVGSESTLITILEATVNLVDSPRHRVLVILGYGDIFEAADRVPDVLNFGPIGLEGVDQKFIHDLRKKELHFGDLELYPEGHGYLLVEFGGASREEALGRARKMMEHFKEADRTIALRLYENPDEQSRVWSVRESGLGATAHIPGNRENWEGWEDTAVHPDKLGVYLRELDGLVNRYGYYASLYGHFGDGCVHMRIDFGLKTHEGVRKFRRFIEEAADLVVKHGGSLSGEHGDGQSRAELLPKMFGDRIVQAFREFKAIWDPDSMMNPGKIVEPYRITENLRFGPQYHPTEVKTHFQYPEDDFHFSHATERCVGVGLCRKTDTGTMCPSYMVTLEEKHTTRGRARLLFEMLQGDPLDRLWKEQEVREALDLCLACKGCKGECPVQVDMATYKAEFLAHYYKGRLRPRSAYAFGLIHWWAQAASWSPGLVNFLTGNRMTSPILKALANAAPQREIPKFASETFHDWFKRREKRGPHGREVILWADTFNNHFHPKVVKDALMVLESAGFKVRIPKRGLCCGRPLYDYGMLGQAKRQLREILDDMREDIRNGICLVGLEPSCVAVFKDELVNFFPHDLDATRLSEQFFTLGEFLVKKAPDYQPGKLKRKALVHFHCHQKSILDTSADLELLRKMSIEVEMPNSGCCGMAGAFGFHKEHYEVSLQCGERVLLPAVRNTTDRELIVTNGFSCREQIKQCLRRDSLHLAEVLAMANATKGD